MFWGRSFRDITKEMAFTSPLHVELRAKIITYFESSWVSRYRKLFATPVEMNGPNVVFKFK
jgi:hypothetical protein